MRQHWVAVASAEHVRRGREEGFMQVCHGKLAPLRRIQPGDCVVYYSPTIRFRSKEKLQAFTAIGIVNSRAPYSSEMGEGPFRRDVSWAQAHETPIAPLLGLLDFSAGTRNWGYLFRFGIFSIGEHDMQIIANAMGAQILA